MIVAVAIGPLRALDCRLVYQALVGAKTKIHFAGAWRVETGGTKGERRLATSQAPLLLR
jgi:hypothetical protein